MGTGDARSPLFELLIPEFLNSDSWFLAADPAAYRRAPVKFRCRRLGFEVLTPFPGSEAKQGLVFYLMISTILFLAQQAPPAGSPAAPGSPGLLPSLLPFVFMIVIFYFLLIRPQQRRQKEQRQLLASLKTGDKVITSSGIHGLIANVKDNTVLLKIADNVKIEVEKNSVATVSRQTEQPKTTT